MMLTIYHDGQFWIGIIELRTGERLKAYRYVFGTEPTSPETLAFINHQLLGVIEGNNQAGVTDTKVLNKKVNPKRL